MGAAILLALTALVTSLLWSSGDGNGDSEDDGVAEAPASLVEDFEACWRPGSWDRQPEVTYSETAERGTKVIGTVTFTNTSDEDIRLWWRQSAYTGAGDVSLKWEGGSVLLPGDMTQVRASHTVLATGMQSWRIPTHVYAASANGECLFLGEVNSPTGTAGEAVDLSFGPNNPDSIPTTTTSTP